MEYTYTPSSTTENSKMSRQTIIMQVINSISNIVNIFVSSFLVSYIMSVNVDLPLSASLISIGVYNISLYIVFTLVYFGISFIVDKTSRISIFRISLVVKGLFIILIIFLGRDIAKYAYIAGAVQGVADALYWASYNVLKGEIVSRAHFNKYATLGSVLEKIIKIIFPVLIGFLIDISTFLNIAIYVFVIVVIQVVLTFFVKCYKPKGAHFEPLKFLKDLRSNTEDVKRVKRVYPVAFLHGFKTVIGSIVPMLTIYTFKTNLNLGIFTALTAFTSIFVLLIFQKFTKYGKRKWFYLVIGLIMLVSSTIVAVWLQKWSYVLFHFVESMAYVVLSNRFDAERNILIKKTGHYSDIAEHNFIIETLLNIARIFGYILMVVLGLYLDILGLKILTIIVGISVPILAIYESRVEKKEKEIEKQQKSQENSENPIENQSKS